MKIKAIKNVVGPKGTPGEIDCSYMVTIGKEYNVLGVLISKSNWNFYIFTDDVLRFYAGPLGIPKLAPAELFEITDYQTPNHWAVNFLQHTDSQAEVVVGPSFLASNIMFLELLYNYDEAAMKVWNDYCKEYLDDSADLE